MAIVRWNPFNELEKNFYSPRRQYATQPWTPSVDVLEDEDSFLIAAEIPGVDQKDIKVNLDDGTLTISGERKFEDEEKKENYTRRERAYGSFVRRFTVPTTIDREKVEASMDRGILKVKLPKREDIKPRQIDVSVN